MKIIIPNEDVVEAVKRYVLATFQDVKITSLEFVAAPAKSGGIRAEVEIEGGP